MGLHKQHWERMKDGNTNYSKIGLQDWVFSCGWRILEIYIDILYYRFLFIIPSPWKISNLTEVSPPPLGIPWKARAAEIDPFSNIWNTGTSKFEQKLKWAKHFEEFGMRKYAQCQAWPPQCNLEAYHVSLWKNPAALENSGLPRRTQRSAKQW